MSIFDSPNHDEPTGQRELVSLITRALDENRLRWEQARRDRRFIDPAWEFVRIIQAHEGLRRLPADEAATRIERAVPDFLERIPSETSLGDAVDPISAFLDAWDSVQNPEGSVSRLESLYREAAERVIEAPPESGRFGPTLDAPRYALLRVFAALLCEVQVDFGSEPFPVPQQCVAEILGHEQSQVSRWIRNLKQLGLLRLEKKADRSRGRAAEYRFLMS